VAKQPKGELVVVGFNYDLLETKLANKVRSAADRIRERVKKTVEDIIEVGNDLLAVKEALPHGQFLPWLKAEFGWGERSAQNFMSVAEKFKSAKIADLLPSHAASAGARTASQTCRITSSPLRNSESQRSVALPRLQRPKKPVDALLSSVLQLEQMRKSSLLWN
jgi:hypothetical protein